MINKQKKDFNMTNYVSIKPDAPESDSKTIGLKEALESDIPVYTRAMGVQADKSGISHITKAIENKDAVVLDTVYIKTIKPLYLYNMLHKQVTFLNPGTTIPK